MTAVLDFISQFATDTRHKQHLEPDTKTTIKKFLVTQAPIVEDFKQVYPYVSDDLSRIEFRAPNQLARYSKGVELQPGILRSILVNARLKDDEHYSILQDYCDQVTAAPKGQELVVFFLHGQRDKNLHELIDSELEGPVDTKLYDQIRRYTPSKGLSMPEIVREVGMLIANMEFVNEDWNFQEVDCGYHPKQKKDDEEEGDEDSDGDEREDVQAKTYDVSQPQAFTLEHEKALRTNPVMQAFKKDNRLPNQYPSPKVAKQILLSNVSTVDSHMSPLFGKKQSLKDFKLHAITNADQWNAISSIVDHFDTETIQNILRTDQMRLFDSCCSHGIQDGRQLVKNVLSIHAGMPSDIEYPKRYLKRTTPGISREIALHIVNAKM